MGFIMHRNEKGGVLLVLVNIQDDMIELQKLGLLDKLLVDKTTKRHILWGTNAYRERGERYANDCEIFVTLVLFNNLGVIKTRARKAFEQQVGRTKLHGEVATPLWVCNKMIDAIDCEWFGIEHLPKDVWQHIDTLFQQTKKSWKKYVDNKRLEIACGEAPYLIQRYDGTNGMMISVEERTGILDRKLHVVSAYATTQEEWIHWAIRAVEATFGYEYQGDNLLIARVNVIKTFIEFYTYKWNEIPHIKLLNQLITKITWNLWQMDGLTGAIPCYMDSIEETSLFDELITTVTQPLCKIYDWRNLKKSILFSAMKGRQTGMKFDYVIGNPPYQEERENTSDKPIYNLFMDESFGVGAKVELITPGRFLFNAGKTPKDWNEKILNDEHFKVLYYEQKSENIFANTDIKGGVAITYRDSNKNFGPIKVFSQFEELRSITKKIIPYLKEGCLRDIIYLQNKFNLEELYKDYPNYKFLISSNGKERRIVTSSFNKLDVFKENKTLGSIAVLGLAGVNKRTTKWILSKYIEDNGNLEKYKIIVPKSNGSGAIGEILSTPLIGTPLIGTPLIGYTQSFIGIGAFDFKEDAEAALKYIKSKFARTLLGILKITKDNPPEKWRFVIKQDFTKNSDIDWSQPIANIDHQLYQKYGFNQEEINFIEKNVKEMK